MYKVGDTVPTNFGDMGQLIVQSVASLAPRSANSFARVCFSVVVESMLAKHTSGLVCLPSAMALL